MIVSTTTAIDGMPVTEYVGIVTGESCLRLQGALPRALQRRAARSQGRRLRKALT
ncbi:MAG: hypothetical protein M3305_16130 [Actinomycetota bacterium]|nr:hypothetical protein [Actinomycetota bacterium]